CDVRSVASLHRLAISTIQKGESPRPVSDASRMAERVNGPVPARGGKTMSTRGSSVVSWLGASAVIALMLSCASSAAAQTVSPCCAKVCNADGSSTECKPMLLGGLGSGGALAQGCVDVETAPPGSICLGGSLLGGDPAGLISCI